MRNKRFSRSIDDHFKNFDEQFETGKKTVKKGFIGAGIGFAVGVVGGICLGESVNDYVEVLKQAPSTIQYAIDVVSAGVCGVFGAGIGGTIAQISGMYKLSKKL